MFTALIQAIWEEFARYIFHVEVEISDQGGQGPVPQGSGRAARNLQYAGGGQEGQPSALAAAAAGVVPGEVAEAVQHGDDQEVAPVQIETRRVSEEEQIGRNDPCWCGSGKKFKKCHGA